ncbi:MAG: hypothetical protein KC549_18705, partial [Myxococcales bacterium]|nr:hypothetical protein [Myxococcales bacterium]
MNSQALLADLRRMLPALEDDLRGQSGAIQGVLEAQWRQARDQQRTGEAFETWRDAWVTQVAVAWLLSLVFVRYLEDQGFVAPRLAGVGAAEDAADEARQGFIRAFPTLSDADWLRHVLDELAALPGAQVLFGPHNLVRALAPSGDMGKTLLRFFQRRGADGTGLAHVFDDADTRFLGDLYQDLSEDARKRYALLQTPDFVEEFILDRT